MLKIRPATPADVPQILTFIRELALYEREPDAVLATEADLLRDGFGLTKVFNCLIAEWTEPSTEPTAKATADPTDESAAEPTTIPAGFALYFHNYSTWRGHAGIHIEDLFVTPSLRGKGIGKALISRVAAIAVEEGCPRLQWDVLEWNTPAIGFYQKIGARMQSEWRTMRVTGDDLLTLGAPQK
jgi:GNAT superfamily N-acetyltransferase